MGLTNSEQRLRTRYGGRYVLARCPAKAPACTWTFIPNTELEGRFFTASEKAHAWATAPFCS